MEKLFLFFTAFSVLKASSQELEISNWVRVDCGSQTSHYDKNGLLWQTDGGFIKTGTNEQISPNSQPRLDQLRTLRVFKEQNKNCYNLPAPTVARYFIRAMFHYGNYDGQANPPTFALEFDGNDWDMVETSMTYTTYHELLYTSKGDNISVCLTRTQDDQFPFISMLEVWSLPDDAYSIMSKDTAWIKEYRYNYGAYNPILGYPEDNFNRIWNPMIPSGLTPVNASFASLDFTTVNEPPDLAIIQMAEASSSSQPLILSFNFSKINHFDHVAVYFTERLPNTSVSRSFYLFVNNALEFNVTPQYRNCSGYSINTQSIGNLIVSLVPTFGSTLPPVISAIEVYTTSDPLVSVRTSQDDLDGLAVLINSFEQLEGWSGEPCLPRDTEWQWLGCTGTHPPRVTSINLSGYGLSGPLPDFSQMQALETIDLSNNSLDGPIPDFLGKLPSLQLLDLENNHFSGGIPQSLTDNKRLTYKINGNQNLSHPKEKSMALVIGLAVVLPIGLIIVIMVIALVYYFKKKQTVPGQEQAMQMESGGGQGGSTLQGQSLEENGSMTSTEALVRPWHTIEYPIPPQNGEGITTAPTNTDTITNQPVHDNEHTVQTASEEDTSVIVNPGITNQSPMIQDIDEEELNELLRQHGSSGPR